RWRTGSKATDGPLELAMAVTTCAAASADRKMSNGNASRNARRMQPIVATADCASRQPAWSDRAGLLQEPALGEGKRRARRDDEVVEHLDVHERERLGERARE